MSGCAEEGCYGLATHVCEHCGEELCSECRHGEQCHEWCQLNGGCVDCGEAHGGDNDDADPGELHADGFGGFES